MSNRKITPKQLNQLFCSSEYIRKVECSDKDSTDIFLGATDGEVKRWLREGVRNERIIRGVGNKRKSFFSSIIVILLAVVVAFIFSPYFRGILGPEVEWRAGSSSFGWPVPAIVLIMILGFSGFLISPLLPIISMNKLSLNSGFFGMAVGLWWHIHLSFIDATIMRSSMHNEGTLMSIEQLSGPWIIRVFVNAEMQLLLHGGIVFSIIKLFMPAICAVIFVLTMNYWVKCYRGENA